MANNRASVGSHYLSYKKEKFYLSLEFDYFDMPPDPEDEEDENTVARLKELTKLCETMKEEQPYRVDIYVDTFLEESENKILIEAFDALIKNGSLKKIKFCLMGYDDQDPEDLSLLAELFENLILKHYSEEKGHLLEHVRFHLFDFPFNRSDFINYFQNPSFRNFEECIKRLPPSICIPGLSEGEYGFFLSILKHRKRIKLFDPQVDFIDDKNYRTYLEKTLLNNMTLLSVNLECSDPALSQLVQFICARNRFASHYPHYSSFLNYDYSKNPKAINFIKQAYSLAPINSFISKQICVLDHQTTKADLETLQKLSPAILIICMVSQISMDLLGLIPVNSRILIFEKVTDKVLNILKENQCKVIKFEEKNLDFNKVKKEVPYLEIKNYFEGIQNKLSKKNGVIRNLFEGTQGISLILKEGAGYQVERTRLINYLTGFSGIHHVVGINNSIQISADISRKNFEIVKRIVDEYESQQIEMASTQEKQTYLKILQNKFQDKGYALKIECVNEAWQAELILDGDPAEKWRQCISELESIQGIVVHDNQMILETTLSLSDFHLMQEKLNLYEKGLAKKSVKSPAQSTPSSKTESEKARQAEHLDYSFREEKKIPKKKPIQNAKKKQAKKPSKKAQKQPAKGLGTLKKTQGVRHISNPDCLFPAVSGLSVDERQAREKSKAKEKESHVELSTVSMLVAASTSDAGAMASASSTSSESISTSNDFPLFLASSKDSEKRVHCIYNGGQQVESFIYPPIFTDAIKQIKYVLNLNENILSCENGKLSEASFYGLIQLLEMTQKIFELQEVEHKKQTFAIRILDIGSIIDLRQKLKPEHMMRYQNKEKAYKKFEETFISFREQLIHNFHSMIFGYENEFDKNEMMQLDSMKDYKDRFKSVFDRLNAPLEQFNQFASKEERMPEDRLASLLERYASVCSQLESSQDQKDKVIFVSTIKYLAIAIADLSEKLFFPEKNQFIGLIAIRNRLMHVMESEGSGIIRDLVKDDECLKSPEVHSSIAFLKSKMQNKHFAQYSM